MLAVCYVRVLVVTFDPLTLIVCSVSAIIHRTALNQG